MGKWEPITWLMLTDKVSRISIPMRRACERSGNGRISAAAQTYMFFCDCRSSLRSHLRDLPLSLRSRSSHFFHTRSPLRSPDFWPAPLALQFLSSKLKKCIDFRCASSYASGISCRNFVCRSVCPSHACFVIKQNNALQIF